MSGPLAKVGRYQLVTRLAVGGMAEVYLARHGELSGFRTLVVVKKVLPHLAENMEFTTMFLDEARIASQLDHPNIVRIFEVGRASGEYFLVMDLVQGKPVSSLIRRAMHTGTAIEPRLASLIVAHAAAGLHHAHQLSTADGQPIGLVHRDVSPQNILVSFEGGVKVIDFGIARALGRLTSTNAGGTKGKAGYMSPEQARAEEIDHRIDIFALGVVLWEAVCSRRLFTKDTDFATMRAIIYEPLPRPSSVTKVAPALESIIMKALSRDPADRYQSAQDMATALDRYIHQSGGASATDLAALMKSSFAEDQAQWKSLARMALEMEDVPEAATKAEIQVGGSKGLRLLTPYGPATFAAAQRRRWLARGFAVVGLAALVVVALLWATRKPAPTPRLGPSPRVVAPAFTPLAPPPPVAPRVEAPAPPKEIPSTEPDAGAKRRKPISIRRRSPARTKTPPKPPDRRPNPF